MAVVDLATLPKPNALDELLYSSIREQWVDSLTAIDADLAASLVPGDPGYELLNIGAFRELYTRARINDATRNRFLALAHGAGLDELGRAMGVARNVDEVDDDYRVRVHAAQRTKGTGSEWRYEEECLAAHPAVHAAHAVKVSPAVLDIYWTPTEDSDLGERAAAMVAINNRMVVGLPGTGVDDEGFEIRMLTDDVANVWNATVSNYDLTANLHVEPGPDPSDVIARATEAVTALAGGPLRGAGVPVPRSELMAALHVTGVAKVDLTSPVADLPYVSSTYYHPETITITHETAAWLL